MMTGPRLVDQIARRDYHFLVAAAVVSGRLGVNKMAHFLRGIASTFRERERRTTGAGASRRT
jgi:hypothetical protein